MSYFFDYLEMRFSGSNGTVTVQLSNSTPLMDWCQQHFPDVSTESVVPWAGMRPMMPKVGPGRRSNVFYNTGHGHLGWTYSAATADLVTAAVVEARDGNQSFK